MGVDDAADFAHNGAAFNEIPVLGRAGDTMNAIFL